MKPQKWNLVTRTPINAGHTLDGRIIASHTLLTGESRIEFDSTREEASLISAAPELLDRLIECLGFIESTGAPPWFEKRVREAIEKAGVEL